MLELLSPMPLAAMPMTTATTRIAATTAVATRV
jgi:hypothetical protein